MPPSAAAGDATARRMLVAAETALLSGRADDAQRLLDEAGPLAEDPQLSVRLLQAQARLSLLGGPPVHDAAARLEAAAATTDDPRAAARLLLDAADYCMFAWQMDKAVELAERARDLVADDPVMQAAVKATLGIAHASSGRLDVGLPLLAGWHDFATVATTPIEGVHLLQRVVAALSWAQRHGEAARHAQRFVAAARDTGALGVLPHALALLGHVSLWSGAWDGGTLAAAESLHLAEELDQPALAAYASGVRALYAGARGQDELCRTSADRVLGLVDETGVVMFRDMAFGALGLLEMSRGEPDRALQQFATGIESAGGDGAMVYWQPDHVEALLATGRTDTAARAVDALEQRAATPGAIWEPMMLARCRATGAGDDELDARYAEAIAAQARPEAAWPLARTLFAYGSRLLALGRTADAVARLTEAEEIFVRLHAVGWVERVRALLADESAGTVPVAEPPAAYGIRLLGEFAVTRGTERCPLPGLAAQAVQYVALRGGAVHVDELAEALWPKEDPDETRPRLRNVLSRLRAACGPLLVRDRDSLRLADGTVIDVAVFEAVAARALVAGEVPERLRWAQEAVSAYAGELLPLQRLLEWTVASRERLVRRYVQMLDLLADASSGEERLGWLERAIEVDPYDEQRLVDVARLHLAAGRRGRAAEVLVRAARVAEDLGIAPPPSLEELT